MAARRHRLLDLLHLTEDQKRRVDYKSRQAAEAGRRFVEASYEPVYDKTTIAGYGGRRVRIEIWKSLIKDKIDEVRQEVRNKMFVPSLEIPDSIVQAKMTGDLYKLTLSDVAYCMYVGGLRYFTCKTRGERPRSPYKFESNGVINHLEGAFGEVAAAGYLGLPEFELTVEQMRRNGEAKKRDVCGYEIRATTSRPELMVRADEEDDDIFIQFRGAPPIYRPMCWAHGKHVKKLGRYNDTYGPPAHFLAERLCHPLDTLPETKEYAVLKLKGSLCAF